jgi:hypothetical protein
MPKSHYTALQSSQKIDPETHYSRLRSLLYYTYVLPQCSALSLSISLAFSLSISRCCGVCASAWFWERSSSSYRFSARLFFSLFFSVFFLGGDPFSLGPHPLFFFFFFFLPWWGWGGGGGGRRRDLDKEPEVIKVSFFFINLSMNN